MYILLCPVDRLQISFLYMCPTWGRTQKTKQNNKNFKSGVEVQNIGHPLSTYPYLGSWLKEILTLSNQAYSNPVGSYG